MASDRPAVEYSAPQAVYRLTLNFGGVLDHAKVNASEVWPRPR